MSVIQIVGLVGLAAGGTASVLLFSAGIAEEKVRNTTFAQAFEAEKRDAEAGNARRRQFFWGGFVFLALSLIAQAYVAAHS